MKNIFHFLIKKEKFENEVNYKNNSSINNDIQLSENELESENIFPLNTNKDDIEYEIDNYLNFELKNTDILFFWSAKQLEFKNLSRIFFYLWVLFPSNGAIERQFSTLRLFVENRRNRTNISLVNERLFIKAVLNNNV